jgi:hypothetical protein
VGHGSVQQRNPVVPGKCPNHDGKRVVGQRGHPVRGMAAVGHLVRGIAAVGFHLK